MGYGELPKLEERRSWPAFAVSSCVHGALLAWLAMAAAHTPREVRRTLYDQEIRPYEKQIVWYNLRDKLPDIKPAAAPATPKPARARRKFEQVLVSGEKDDAAVPQMIATEAPPAELPKPLPLPNVVAEAGTQPPPPPRLYAPPEAAPRTAEAPTLAEPPRVEAKSDAPADPLSASAPRPPAMPFQKPPEWKRAETPKPELADAPRADRAPTQTAASPLGNRAPRPQPLPFQTPPEQRRTSAALILPEPPKSQRANTESAAAPLGNSAPKPQPKTFQAPPPARARATAPALGDAPASAASAPSEAARATARIPRGFTAPPAKNAERAPAPAIEAAAPAANPGKPAQSMAIASLDPAPFSKVPEPPVSHAAGFSGAPEVRPDASAPASNENAALMVPSLTAGGGVRDASPTVAPQTAARAMLIASLGNPLAPAVPKAPAADVPHALRVTAAPHPRLAGRVIYTMAIQMPNVTSYTGSWMVWFAEQAPAADAPARNLRPPVAVRKVDPAYVRSAVDDRKEGLVRMAAVISKEGRVESIELLSGIDQRLDRSTVEALSKWLFEPARRDGQPIDVDAIFEVPFRLAPQTSR